MIMQPQRQSSSRWLGDVGHRRVEATGVRIYRENARTATQRRYYMYDLLRLMCARSITGALKKGIRAVLTICGRRESGLTPEGLANRSRVRVP